MEIAQTSDFDSNCAYSKEGLSICKKSENCHECLRYSRYLRVLNRAIDDKAKCGSGVGSRISESSWIADWFCLYII